MANDIDMWNDIERLEEGTEREKEMAGDLQECYRYRYMEFKDENYGGDRAEQLKRAFQRKWGFWNNYY